MLLTKMATDFRISGSIQMRTLKQTLVVFFVILIMNPALALSVWMPQFLSGGHGRNIRHLPCVSRKTGEQGICMFAYTCMKSNGTHLGTCIDRFYFGSCCKLEGDNDLLADNQINFQPINNNQVLSSKPESSTKIHNKYTTSLPNLLINTISGVSGSNHSKVTTLSSPSSTRTTSTMQPPKVSGGSHGGPSTHKTGVDSAQNLPTQTHLLTPSTEKIYIPIHTSMKPNKTENLGSGSGLFTTHGSSSSIHGESKRPTTQSQGFHESSTQAVSTTTQSYYLSTFQVVHNENGGVAHKPSTTVFTKVTTLTPSTLEPVTTWTPIKHITTVPTTQIKRNTTVISSKPTFTTTTTKKPIKPVKPVTTTRKPPPKKPTSKPVTKPVTTIQPTKAPIKKPIQSTFTNRITTTKPTVPVKKPIQPTKKPVLSSPKPSTIKPSTTHKPVLLTRLNTTTTSNRPVSSVSSSVPSGRPSSTTKTPVYTKIPTHSTFTTSETVFTKPALISSFTEPATDFGITTFRPDLSPTSKKPGLITGPYLTTFNYTTEGIKTPSTESSSATISNEISSETVFESIPEIQEENSNVIFQQMGSTGYPSSMLTTEFTRLNGTNVPFFPEAVEPSSTKPPWIQIVQTTKPSLASVSTTTAAVTTETPTLSPPTKTTTPSTTRPTYTVIPLLPGVNTSDYTQVCGRRLFPQSRIVGGEKSTFGKWPWQISLRQWKTSTYLHKCGAALVNENWAITAAHCVENVPPTDLLLRLGEHDLSTEDEPYGFQERRVQLVASHPQFDPRTFEYDLALLRFYEPVKFQPNIIPICIPEDDTNFVGQTAYVTGWGRLYEDGPLPSVLQEVSVPVINNTLCENMYRSAGYIEHIPKIFICAGWKKGGFDSCEGDSGGPMVLQRPDKRWLLAGVISWGIGCAEPNQPGVYTRISEFREWIHQILQF